MKSILALVLSMLAIASAHRSPAFTRALNIRGGAKLGPLDGDLAMKVAKTAATAYVAGAGSKFIADKTGGGSTNVSVSIGVLLPFFDE